MKEFIITNWLSILYVVLFLVFIGYLVANKKWATLRRVAYQMILEAENAIKGSKMGEQKFKHVVNQMYWMLVPKWMRWLIPKSKFEAKLQEWYNDVKDYLRQINSGEDSVKSTAKPKIATSKATQKPKTTAE